MPPIVNDASARAFPSECAADVPVAAGISGIGPAEGGAKRSRSSANEAGSDQPLSPASVHAGDLAVRRGAVVTSGHFV
jgi:hypothetical protein